MNLVRHTRMDAHLVKAVLANHANNNTWRIWIASDGILIAGARNKVHAVVKIEDLAAIITIVVGVVGKVNFSDAHRSIIHTYTYKSNEVGGSRKRGEFGLFITNH